MAEAVTWPNSAYTYPKGISSDYGPRTYVPEGAKKFHKGLDFVGDKNVRAVESGTVIENNVPLVIIQGTKTVRYFHMAQCTLNIGTYVSEGTIIGQYEDHLDIKLDKIFTNPLRDLFSPLYTGSAPQIQYFKLTGDVKEHDGKYYIKKGAEKVTLETYILTETKDLDVVEFSSDVPMTGLPCVFDYHNHSQWANYDGLNLNDKMRCRSYDWRADLKMKLNNLMTELTKGGVIC